MVTKKAAGVLVAMLFVGLYGCASSGERGPMQDAGANAGRVIDDSVITAKVKTALISESDTKAYQINVETFQGVVQLNGFVDDANARRRAEQVAQEVEGVKRVQNNLQLRN
jgi:Predicted periplasmic or secreted lipoprotein